MAKLEALYERVCGLEVHKKSVVACRRRLTSSGRIEKEVATFGTTTAQGLALLGWLQEWAVTPVAMASTGVYWKPVWNLLEGPVELLLVKARHLQTGPGRKTDVTDAEWIAQLLPDGLRRGSGVPSLEVRPWRDRRRHRSKLMGPRPSVVNRRHTGLEDAKVKLSSVRSDLMGGSGLRMLRAMVEGETAAEGLRQLGAPKLRASQDAWPARLPGQRTEPHRFMVEGLLAQGAFLEAQMARLDGRLEEQLRPFEAQRKRLATIDGIDRGGAQSVLAEWGPDRGQFPDADHRSSWAGRSPGNDERAGQRRSGKTAKGNKGLRRTLTPAAWAATRRQRGSLSAQYRRLAARRGKHRAIVAVGHTILVAAYDILRDEGAYHELGSDHCDRLRRERTVANVVSRLPRLGYNVALEAIESEAA
jgi:transposase